MPFKIDQNCAIAVTRAIREDWGDCVPPFDSHPFLDTATCSILHQGPRLCALGWLGLLLCAAAACLQDFDVPTAKRGPLRERPGPTPSG